MLQAAVFTAHCTRVRFKRWGRPSLHSCSSQLCKNKLPNALWIARLILVRFRLFNERGGKKNRKHNGNRRILFANCVVFLARDVPLVQSRIAQQQWQHYHFMPYGGFLPTATRTQWAQTAFSTTGRDTTSAQWPALAEGSETHKPNPASNRTDYLHHRRHCLSGRGLFS